LVEEYLEGPLVSVETVSYQNEVHVLGITDRSVGKPPYFVAETASFPAKMDHEHEVIQMVIDALQAIHFDFGPAHTEVIITKDGPRIVEINPRLAGGPISLMMNWSFGRSFHEEIVKMFMGMPFSFESERKGIGAYLRIFSDKTGILKNIEGLDLAYQVPGIKNIYLEHELGDLVSHSPKGLADGLGVISAFGEDKEEIIKNLYEARSKLNVVVHRVDKTFFHLKGVF
jgi:biotin carboxylase